MGLINCPECNKEISDYAVACPHCGYPMNMSPNEISATKIPLIHNNEANIYPYYMEENIKEESRWTTTKLILGILSMILVLIIGFQSCIYVLGNTILYHNIFSLFFCFTAVLFITVAGIVGIVSRNSKSKIGPIACCILYGISPLILYVGAGSNIYLRVLGSISFVFGYIFLFSVLQKQFHIVISSFFALILMFLSLGCSVYINNVSIIIETRIINKVEMSDFTTSEINRLILDNFNSKQEYFGYGTYDNIKIYPRVGLKENTYFIFTTFQINLKNIKTPMPAMSLYYIIKNDDGDLLLQYVPKDEKAREYIEDLEGKDVEIKSILEKINADYKDALSKDPDLKAFFNKIKAS